MKNYKQYARWLLGVVVVGLGAFAWTLKSMQAVAHVVTTVSAQALCEAAKKIAFVIVAGGIGMHLPPPPPPQSVQVTPSFQNYDIPCYPVTGKFESAHTSTMLQPPLFPSGCTPSNPLPALPPTGGISGVNPDFPSGYMPPKNSSLPAQPPVSPEGVFGNMPVSPAHIIITPPENFKQPLHCSVSTSVQGDTGYARVVVSNQPASQRIARSGVGLAGLRQGIQFVARDKETRQHMQTLMGDALDLFILKRLCMQIPQIAQDVYNEVVRLSDIFFSCLQPSASPEIIAQQLELCSFPHGFDVCEAFPGFAKQFKRPVERLQRVLFHSDGSFKGIITDADRFEVAKALSAFIRHHCADNQAFCAELKRLADHGLYGFDQLYKNECSWLPSLPTISLTRHNPQALAQAIAHNSFNQDLKLVSRLCMEDPFDQRGCITQAQCIVNRYVHSTSLSGRDCDVSHAQEQVKILQDIVSPHYTALYNEHGIRLVYENDPLCSSLVQSIDAQQLTVAQANDLLHTRASSRAQILQAYGLHESAVTPALDTIVYTMLDAGADTNAVQQYLEACIVAPECGAYEKAYAQKFLDAIVVRDTPPVVGGCLPQEKLPQPICEPCSDISIHGCDIPSAEIQTVPCGTGLNEHNSVSPVKQRLKVARLFEYAWMRVVENLKRNPQQALALAYSSAAEQYYKMRLQKHFFASEAQPVKIPQSIPKPTSEIEVPGDIEIEELPELPQEIETPGSATVEDILAEATPGAKTGGRSTIYSKPGGFKEANRDFDRLPLSDVKDCGNGIRTGILPDGRKVTVRPKSSGERASDTGRGRGDGPPTLEIQDIDPQTGKVTGDKTKVRYE